MSRSATMPGMEMPGVRSVVRHVIVAGVGLVAGVELGRRWEQRGLRVVLGGTWTSTVEDRPTPLVPGSAWHEPFAAGHDSGELRMGVDCGRGDESVIAIIGRDPGIMSLVPEASRMTDADLWRGYEQVRENMRRFTGGDAA